MTRLPALLSILALLLLLGFPAVAAAQGPEAERGVLVGVREAVTLDAGSNAAAVVSVQSHVTVSGHARVVIVVDGDVELTGPAASVDTLVVVHATVTLGPGTTVGTIRALDSKIVQDPSATVEDGIQDLQGSVLVLVGILGTFLVLLYLGWAVAVLVAGAALAAVAARQTRRMSRSVSAEPLKVLGAGLLGLFVPLILGVLLFVTIIGIPLGVLVFLMLALAAFVGYLVMGVWLGDLLLHRGGASGEGRPIGSALLGLFLLLIASLIPLVSFFVGWFGLGTVTLDTWRAMMGRDGGNPPQPAVGAGAPWSGQPQGWGPPPGPPQPQSGWSPPPGPVAPPPGSMPPPPGPMPPPPGWGTPGAGTPGTQGWQQPRPPAGPPPGWGQPPSSG